MKRTNIILETAHSRLWKKAIQIISMTALLVAAVLGNFQTAFAQFTFVGDYDKTFAAPLGYYLDPQDPVPTIEDYQTNFFTGELLPNGSIIAGGRHVDGNLRGAFYLRKFTPNGAVDGAFGLNGVVRTIFYLGVSGQQILFSNDSPQVLKVQPDGKILFAGQCSISSPNEGVPAFGIDGCVVRYNPDGSIDDTFGNVTVMTGGGINGAGEQNPAYTFEVGPGRFMTQTGVIDAPGSPGPRRGTGGRFYDMAIQPDGKIILVGETRNDFTAAGNVSQTTAFILRLNANGTRDNSFGLFGIVQMAPTQAFLNCYPSTGFQGVRLQEDGRIIALGYSHSDVDGNCFQANRFAVTRWTANGQLETIRYFDNNTAPDGRREVATTAFFTRDGNKILVSGSYQGKATMMRLNTGNLTLDPTFGNNGIRRYSIDCSGTNQISGTLYIKAVQPDGKIIGIDTDGGTPVVRFNPDGTPDLSFGNPGQPGGASGGCGRLRLNMIYYNGQNYMFTANHILQRANGRTILLGAAPQGSFNEFRSAVSQQNTTFQNGVYADFENDGRDNISVFRDGNWYWLNSTNGSFNAAQFGISSDKLAPADYDGDGKTDLAVFRDGAWYIIQSSNGAFRALNFGSAGDLPRPGDFDGDGLADISVFRPSNGTWYRVNSANNQFVAVQFGAGGDAPLIADFDGDSRSDIAVFRAGTWYYIRSSDNQFVPVQFGTGGDIPTPGDYDGDSRADLAVFRPSNGFWYIARSSGSGNPSQNFDSIQFGQNGDKPVPGDYDNDGKNDFAVYRGGAWYIIFSGNSTYTVINFGLANDRPIEAAYTQP
ncbi:MAG TPA: FG-GAP-like repeat-containing protein [Pyrinomonadaceae bacterium]|jgi:uncharacterized delta-60 repeat protein